MKSAAATLLLCGATLASAQGFQLKALVALADTPALGFQSVPTARQLGLPVRGTVSGGLVLRKGDDFKRFALTEFESFKTRVVANGLQER